MGWYRFDSPEPIKSKYHWHQRRVKSLAFTPDGSYLLSGGDECVLVMWQLETGHKSFLPRIGSAIRHISVSPTGRSYALSCVDNAIRFVNAVENKIKFEYK